MDLLTSRRFVREDAVVCIWWDLCKIDAINKQFCDLTADAWVKVTNKRFGMKNGKEGWKVDTSFLRKPVFINLCMTPGHDNMWYAGTPNVATHNSFIAVVSDDHINDNEAPEGECSNNIHHPKGRRCSGPNEMIISLTKTDGT
jgi:hypothetical protein